jgi:hypothetical protein
MRRRPPESLDERPHRNFFSSSKVGSARIKREAEISEKDKLGSFLSREMK